jgi:hypothetical protein
MKALIVIPWVVFMGIASFWMLELFSNPWRLSLWVVFVGRILIHCLCIVGVLAISLRQPFSGRARSVSFALSLASLLSACFVPFGLLGMFPSGDFFGLLALVILFCVLGPISTFPMWFLVLAYKRPEKSFRDKAYGWTVSILMAFAGALSPLMTLAAAA